MAIWAVILCPAIGQLGGFCWKDILRVYTGLLILAVTSDILRRYAIVRFRDTRDD